MRGLVALLLCLAGCDEVLGLDRPITTYRKSITLKPVAGSLVDFPAAIVIEDPALTTHVVADRFVFTSADGTVLAHEVESYQPGNLAAWVRIPLLEPGTMIYVYYGVESGLPTASALPSDVWRSEYAAVWHLAGSELGEGRDSTNNGNDLQQSVPDLQPASDGMGIVGSARLFDGNPDPLVADTLVAHDQPSLDPGIESFTYSVWVKVDRFVGDYDMALHKGGSAVTSSETGYDFELGKQGWVAQISDGSGLAVNRVAIDETKAMARVGRWAQLVAVIDRELADLRIYLDGNLENVLTSLTEGSLSGTDDLSLSRSSLDDVFAGSIDEVRLFHGVLSEDWIHAEYRNISDPARFLEVGAEEIVAD